MLVHVSLKIYILLALKDKKGLVFLVMDLGTRDSISISTDDYLETRYLCTI